MSITPESRRITRPMSVFIILSFEEDFKLSFIPAIEYRIPLITINRTADRSAIKVKYLIILPKSAETSQNPFGTLQLITPSASGVPSHTPGIPSVIPISTAHSWLANKKLEITSKM